MTRVVRGSGLTGAGTVGATASPDPLTTWLLQDALDDYIEAKTSYDEARGEFPGYDWDYYGAHHIARLERARAAFDEAFVDAVRAIAKEA